MEWEYNIIPFGDDKWASDIEDRLSELGKNRWELVTSYSKNYTVYFVLKRTKGYDGEPR